MNATVPVPIETLQAIVKGLGSIMVASGEVSVQVQEIIDGMAGVGVPSEPPAALAPVVRLDDYRRTRGGAA